VPVSRCDLNAGLGQLLVQAAWTHVVKDRISLPDIISALTPIVDDGYGGFGRAPRLSKAPLLVPVLLSTCLVHTHRSGRPGPWHPSPQLRTFHVAVAQWHQ
jgi:hypothetical protein